MAERQRVFFKKQSFFSLQCGRYSVNHLLGNEVYDKSQFNEICYELSDDIINPHKHIFGGDYDVNVLMIALEKRGLNSKWYDNRQGKLKVPDKEEEQQVVGYLVNIFSEGAPGFIHKLCGISKRHWLAIRRLDQKYYWMDSKEETHKPLTAKQVQTQLNRLIASSASSVDQRAVILTIFKKDAAKQKA